MKIKPELKVNKKARIVETTRLQKFFNFYPMKNRRKFFHFPLQRKFERHQTPRCFATKLKIYN
jgi:hypothetical protein